MKIPNYDSGKVGSSNYTQLLPYMPISNNYSNTFRMLMLMWT